MGTEQTHVSTGFTEIYIVLNESTWPIDHFNDQGDSGFKFSDLSVKIVNI